MKKIALTMALIAGVVAGAITLCAFTKPAKMDSVLEITASPVWEGTARVGSFESREVSNYSNQFKYIRVYPTDNSCGAYYAVVVTYGNEGSVHYTVKSNPYYDYSCNRKLIIECYSHYVTIGDDHYFFKM